MDKKDELLQQLMKWAAGEVPERESEEDELDDEAWADFHRRMDKDD